MIDTLYKKTLTYTTPHIHIQRRTINKTSASNENEVKTVHKTPFFEERKKSKGKTKHIRI